MATNISPDGAPNGPSNRPSGGPSNEPSVGPSIGPLIGIVALSDENARVCAASVERLGGRALRIDVSDGTAPDVSLRLIGALVCCDDAGAGDAAVALVRAAIDDDLPIYAIGEGMQLLNIAFGGRASIPIAEHVDVGEDGGVASAFHHIYIAPGSRLAAVVGSGGFVRVNSRHSDGIREAQKSSWLLASAYSLEDGVIEALESSRHRWIIGVQFRPERRLEVPPHFDRLFQSLLERAAERMKSANFPR